MFSVAVTTLHHNFSFFCWVDVAARFLTICGEISWLWLAFLGFSHTGRIYIHRPTIARILYPVDWLRQHYRAECKQFSPMLIWYAFMFILEPQICVFQSKSVSSSYKMLLSIMGTWTKTGRWVLSFFLFPSQKGYKTTPFNHAISNMYPCHWI